ncbi:septal junction protein FraD [Mastigocladopsis repens]|uniref:septal junction protein FraD n=1 Tax=Mastigocladopsis repens TaxID=221287 RepID=UPI000312D81C|nr:septal junction protein FraD [Mastigocladopsis repens]
MQILRDFFGIVGVIEDVYERIKKIVIPPRAYSWQTLIYLSIFSWLMSSLSTAIVKDIIAFCGWLFLIIGTAWYTTDNPLLIPGTNMPVGSVITGFLVSVFAFGREEDIFTPRTIVLWPTISALITAIPEFFEGTGTEATTRLPKIEDRQKIIILIGSCMVLSCWLQFYFVTENWINEYPSLLIDNYQGSAFVIKTQPSNKIPRNGVLILDKLAPQVEAQIAGQPWSQVEQWLIDARERVGNLSSQVIQTNLSEYEERFLWIVEPRVSNLKDGYKLDLLNIWSGPSSTPRGYYLVKSCRIDPVLESGNTSSQTARKTEQRNTIAEIECERKTSFFAGSPPPQQ